jgi:hypothetical protein
MLKFNSDLQGKVESELPDLRVWLLTARPSQLCKIKCALNVMSQEKRISTGLEKKFSAHFLTHARLLSVSKSTTRTSHPLGMFWSLQSPRLLLRGKARQEAHRACRLPDSPHSSTMGMAQSRFGKFITQGQFPCLASFLKGVFRKKGGGVGPNSSYCGWCLLCWHQDRVIEAQG